MTSTYRESTEQKQCEILRIYELVEDGKITIPVPGRLRGKPCKMTVSKGVVDMAGSSLLLIKSNILGNSYDTGTQGTNVVLGTAINNEIPNLRASVIRADVNADNASSNVITGVTPTVSVSSILPGDMLTPDGVYIDTDTKIESIAFANEDFVYTLSKATLAGNSANDHVMFVTPSETLDIFSPLNESVPLVFYNVTLPPEIDIQIVNKTGAIQTEDRYVEVVLSLEF